MPKQFIASCDYYNLFTHHLVPLPQNAVNMPSSSLYCCQFNESRSYPDIINQLPEDLKQEIANAVPARQIQFLAGRYCAIKAMTLLNLASPQWIKKQANRAPLWPAGIVGSISHTQNFAIAAVATTPDILSIGIDIEHNLNAQRAEQITDYILAGACSPTHSLPYLQFITLVFSAKETLYKALSPLTNTILEFDSADCVAITPEHCRLRLRRPLLQLFNIEQEFDIEYTFWQDMVITRLILLQKMQ